MAENYAETIAKINSLIWQIRDRKAACDAGEIGGVQLTAEQQQSLQQDLNSLYSQVQQEVTDLGGQL